MAVSPECDEEIDDDDEEVKDAVRVGAEGEKIKAEKERKLQKLGDPRKPT